jgi:flagellar basal-body rod protein FlgB
MINPTDNPMFPALEDLLSWTSKRQQALAANIANLDTPGYRAKDYKFEEALSTIDLASTSSKHISPVDDSSRSRLYEEDTNVKPNGNSVDIEREMSALTKNGLEYITLVQYLNQKIKTLRSAISEGGKV